MEYFIKFSNIIAKLRYQYFGLYHILIDVRSYNSISLYKIWNISLSLVISQLNYVTSTLDFTKSWLTSDPIIVGWHILDKTSNISKLYIPMKVCRCHPKASKLLTSHFKLFSLIFYTFQICHILILKISLHVIFIFILN